MTRSTILTLGFILTSAMLFTACQILPQSTPTPDTQTGQQQTASPAPESSSVSATTQTRSIAQIETTYTSPAGEERVGFKIIVDDEGVITDAQTTVYATAPISLTRQENFAKELPAALKGKKLATLTSIDRVGGSSLTTGAFNKALEQLKSQI